MRRAFETRALTAAAPWTSILRMTSWPAREGVEHLPARRPVPVTVDLGALEQLAPLAQLGELGPAHEVVAAAVDLAGARRPRGAGHHVVELGIMGAAAERLDDGVLADAGWPADDDQHGAGGALLGGRSGRRLVERPAHRTPPPTTRRRPSRGRSRSSGRGASARMSRSPEGAMSSSRQACRKSRSRPSGPRRAWPVA